MVAHFSARFTTPLLCVALLAGKAGAQLPAFPGAEGFGAAASGGRGGDVYHVTNLNDAGFGSLRDAVSAGPRIVVFDVGGYVELKAVLRIASDITIAGQTAPGDGIGTKNYEVSLSGAHNVIVRHVRFRAGETAGQEARSAVVMTGSRDIILDHCSLQFGRWDTLQLIGSTNITVQNSIVGPSIGRQLGCLCASDDVTFSHNLFASNFGRSVKARGKIQFVNNVVYNWQHDAFADGGHSRGSTWNDLVGNYFIAGPATDRAYPIAGGSSATHVHAAGNFLDGNRDGKLNGTALTDADLGPVTVEKYPYAAPPIAVKADPADVAYDKVVAGAGCALHRDAVDTRLIADLTSLGKKGKLVTTPSEIGGLGELKSGTPPRDTDGDGIPDDWELSHNLDPKNYADRNTLDTAGYTMIEVYINSLADQKTIPGTNTFTLKVDPGTVQAKPGTKTKISVTATRKGYDGPINLELHNLPAGITAPKASIPQGQTAVDVNLAFDKGATGNRDDVQVRGTQSDGKGSVNSPNFTVHVSGTNFTLSIAPATLKIKAGAKASVVVTADRKDYTGAINVQLVGLPAHLKAAAATIPAGQNAVTIEISADAKASVSGNVLARGTAGKHSHDSAQIGVVVMKK